MILKQLEPCVSVCNHMSRESFHHSLSLLYKIQMDNSVSLSSCTSDYSNLSMLLVFPDEICRRLGFYSRSELLLYAFGDEGSVILQNPLGNEPIGVSLLFRNQYLLA